MKNMIMMILALGISTTIYAGSKVTKDATRTVAEEDQEIDCGQPQNSTYEMNYCAFVRSEAMAKKLESRILKKCLNAPSVQAMKGGTGENSAVGNCQAKMYDELSKAAWHMFPK